MLANALIRPAQDSEARACRMLLPAMFGPLTAPDLLLVATIDGALAGALGTAPLFGARGVSVDAQVIPPLRRRGIGRALIEAAAARLRAPSLRGPDLRGLRAVEPGTEAALFLAACGFDQTETVLHFETDTAAFHADMSDRRRRLEQRGRIPPGAVVVPLHQAPPAQLATLVAANFPATASMVLRRLDPAGPDAFDLDRSVALLVHGAVRAALIYNWNAGLPVIEVRVVDPALRGGWANTLILEQATRNGLRDGATRFRFFAEATVADTMKLARRAGAQLIRTDLHVSRRLY